VDHEAERRAKEVVDILATLRLGDIRITMRLLDELLDYAQGRRGLRSLSEALERAVKAPPSQL